MNAMGEEIGCFYIFLLWQSAPLRRLSVDIGFLYEVDLSIDKVLTIAKIIRHYLSKCKMSNKTQMFILTDERKAIKTLFDDLDF